MGKPHKKGLRKRDLSLQQKKAFEIYMDSKGQASVLGISKLLKVNRKTVTRWKVDDEWDKRLEELKQKTDSKVAEAISTKHADVVMQRAEKLFGEDLAFFEAAGQISMAKLFKYNPATGEPERTAEGKIILDKTLTPSDLRRLISARAEQTRAVRLLAGLTTENRGMESKVDATVTAVKQAKGEVEKKIEEAFHKGDAAAQQALIEISRLMTNFRKDKEES